MTKHFIKEQYNVEAPDAAKDYGKGERREDFADPWRETGRVALVGLEGSGKRNLAALLAERMGVPVVVPEDAGQAASALEGERAVIVLDDSLVEDEAVQPLIHSAGKVFYLLADTRTLAGRVAERDGVDREKVWNALSDRLAVMEPVFYSVLHFILQAGDTSEEMAADAMEKIAL